MASPTYAKGEGTQNLVTTPAFVPGEILVKSKPGKSVKMMSSLFGTSTLHVDELSGMQKVKLPAGESITYSMTQYANNPDVEYAEPNYISKISLVPDDAYYPKQWALTKINAPMAWDLSKGSPSVVIAIIDSGIDYTHPDLSGKIVSPYNSVTGSTDLASVLDDEGHGTHVVVLLQQGYSQARQKISPMAFIKMADAIYLGIMAMTTSKPLTDIDFLPLMAQFWNLTIRNG